MTHVDALPKDYRPFPKIIVCSNMLINVQIPFEVNGQVPLLIGNAKSIKVWLNIVPSEKNKSWQPLIRANRSMHPAASVQPSQGNELSVKLDRHTVLRVVKDTQGTPEVILLDLRPVGLNIHGNQQGLTVGVNHLSRNTFENVRVMVGIGD